MAGTTTLLRVLVIKNHWQVYETFCLRFEQAANELSRKEGDNRLRGMSVSKRTFERWYGGTVKSLPHPNCCRVLEFMFGHPVASLLESAPEESSTLRFSVGVTVGGEERPATSPDLKPEEHHLILRGKNRIQAQDFRISPGPDAPLYGSLTSGNEALFLRSERGQNLDLERQISMAARRALRFTTIAEGSNVGPQTIAQLQSEVQRLATAYPRESLSLILGDLAETQDDVFRLLENGRQRPNEARDLYLLAGITCGMLAKASHDLGDPRSALTQARTAYVCAENSGHSGLRSWILGLQSLVTYWAGWPTDALRYAQLGVSNSNPSDGTSSVWLSALEARASAALGDAETMQTAVRRAEEIRGQVEPGDLDSFGGIMSFPIPRQLYYAAHSAVSLPGQSSDVEELAENAVEAYDNASPGDWAFGDHAGARSDLALARIIKGELEGGIEALRPVLDLPHEQRIRGIVASALRVHGALRGSPSGNSNAAKELRAEIEAFSQTPPPALPYSS